MSSIQNVLARVTLEVVQAHAEQNADFSSAAFDWRDKGLEGLITFVLSNGAGGGTNPTCAAKLQHCDTSGGTYVDVPAGAFAAIATAAGTQKLTIDTRTLKQFVKLNCDLGGTNPVYDLVCAVLGFKKYIS